MVTGKSTAIVPNPIQELDFPVVVRDESDVLACSHPNGVTGHDCESSIGGIVKSGLLKVPTFTE